VCILILLGFALVSTTLTLGVGYVMPYPFTAEHQPAKKDEAPVTIAVASNDWHTSLLLPRQTPVWNWDETIEPQDISSLAEASARQWLSFGWGERSFYAETPQFADFSFQKAFYAVFVSEQFVLHVGLEHQPIPDESLRVLSVNSAQYLSLVNYVKQTFLLDDKGKARRVLDGFSQTDAFFDAGMDYTLLFTCNTWVAEALRSAGIPTPWWSGTAGAIMRHLP
jgi:uncharacterized protein (TIGR02117 family)